MTTHTLMLMALALTTAACSTASASPPKEQPAEHAEERPEDRPAAQSATPSEAMCAANLTLPAEDVFSAPEESCARAHAMLEAQPTRIEYPCEGGPAQLFNAAGESVTNYVNSIEVTRDGASLIIEAHSAPMLIYNCDTHAIERLVTNLETGASTYTYEDEWRGKESHPESGVSNDHCMLTCPIMAIEGEFLTPR